MSDKKSWVTSVFRVEGIDNWSIEFDPEDAGNCRIRVEDLTYPARHARELIQAFEDKFPFAFEETEKKD